MQEQTRNVPLEEASIKLVESMKELCEENFDDKANVILFRRSLSLDFNALAADLRDVFKDVPDMKFQISGIKILSSEMLEAALPQVSDESKKALSVILDDMRSLDDKWDVNLRLIAPCEDDKEGYHADTVSDGSLGRVLCCYNTPTTEGLLPREVFQTASGIRSASGVTPFNFQVGDMWRGAADSYIHSAKKTPSFVHRAPASDKTRLLLLAEPAV